MKTNTHLDPYALALAESGESLIPLIIFTAIAVIPAFLMIKRLQKKQTAVSFLEVATFFPATAGIFLLLVSPVMFLGNLRDFKTIVRLLQNPETEIISAKKWGNQMEITIGKTPTYETTVVLNKQVRMETVQETATITSKQLAILNKGGATLNGVALNKIPETCPLSKQ